MWFQGIVSAVILGIAVVFLDNPGCKSMPAVLHDTLIGVFVTAFLIFMIFILREKPKDEREMFHVLKSGRTAYLSGLVILMTGIVMQTINHQTDPWLVAGTGVMVLTKITTSIYASHKL
jgi:hypothetical protein